MLDRVCHNAAGSDVAIGQLRPKNVGNALCHELLHLVMSRIDQADDVPGGVEGVILDVGRNEDVGPANNGIEKGHSASGNKCDPEHAAAGRGRVSHGRSADRRDPFEKLIKLQVTRSKEPHTDLAATGYSHTLAWCYGALRREFQAFCKESIRSSWVGIEGGMNTVDADVGANASGDQTRDAVALIEPQQWSVDQRMECDDDVGFERRCFVDHLVGDLHTGQHCADRWGCTPDLQTDIIAGHCTFQGECAFECLLEVIKSHQRLNYGK